MSHIESAAMFGLRVPPGNVTVPAEMSTHAVKFRITMAAIDPSEPIEDGDGNGNAPSRAILKLIKYRSDDSDDEDDLDYIDDGSDDESSDEDQNGGPSDPSKSVKARLARKLEADLANNSDDDMDVDSVVEKLMSAAAKGKARATGDELDDDSELGYEEFVLCTLDTSKNYQQPLDLILSTEDGAYFSVSGSHTIYLTGNYLKPVDDEDESDDELDAYDLGLDEDELLDGDESDKLDELEDPRITEIDSEEEEAVQKPKKDAKGKNKRVHPDSDEIDVSLDDIMAKSLKPEEKKENGKLSKKQLKKLKKNNGEAAAATPVVTSKPEPKEAATQPREGAKADKKVQFAKNIEQVESAKSSKKEKLESPKPKETKASLGVKNVNGVKVDDRKIGEGPVAKKGNRVSLRYIGRLESTGKVFDANKKGKPFSFKLGDGDVIKGWDIGVAGMAVGGERRLTIPAHLAYGSKGMPGIPANSTLKFDLKCIEIK